MMKINSNYPINFDVLKKNSEITEDFYILESKRFNNNSNIEFLKDLTSKKCRFCGKTYPNVTFKKEAHSIPEFIGNKSLFSLFECDDCNQYFSVFENEFANFMLPLNVLAGTKSKKNRIPKYKQTNQLQITNETDQVLFKNVSHSIIDSSKIDSIDIKVNTPSFIPEYIYRCLVKIGLTILKEENLDIYKETIVWLMNVKIKSNMNPFMLFSIYPFQIQTNEIVSSILVRKDNCKRNVPHSIFFLSYHNFAFQTCIPFSKNEKTGIELSAIPFIHPMSFDLNKNYEGLKNFHYFDLSSQKKKKKSNDYFYN